MLERCRMEAETALLEVIPPDTRRRVSDADTTGLPIAGSATCASRTRIRASGATAWARVCWSARATC